MQWRGLCAKLLVVVGVALQVVTRRAEAKELLVGNQMGWTNYDIKSFKVPNYGAWATSQKVQVGDELVFKYARGMHNVNMLPDKAAYESCDFSKAKLLDAGESGVYVWKATTAGVYYFGCNKEVEEEGNHCGSGQKVALLVRAAGAEGGGVELALAPAPSPATPTASAPSSGSPAFPPLSSGANAVCATSWSSFAAVAMMLLLLTAVCLG